MVIGGDNALLRCFRHSRMFYSDSIFHEGKTILLSTDFLWHKIIQFIRILLAYLMENSFVLTL